MQRTSFPVEIIIGDDDSDDGTRQICQDYAAKYPDRIHLFLRSRKDVIFINGKPTGRSNFVQNIKSARGKYIALCPGDDYWTDPLKLQRQVDILDGNQEYVACHHWQRVTVRNENEIYVEKESPKDGHGYSPAKCASIRDILSNTVRIKSRTIMFRNLFLDGFEFPDWFYTVQFGDVALSIILGKFGDFYFIDDEMAVYRMTGTGVSTMGNQHYLFHYRHFVEWISVWEMADVWFGGKYRFDVVATIRQFYGMIFTRYNYSFRIFIRMFVFAVFRSRFSLLLRMKMGCYLVSRWLSKK